MVTSNMLLQPMQTRWILGLGFSPGLVSAGAWELCGSLINAFYHDAGIADGTRVSSLGAMQLLEITGILCDSRGILLTGGLLTTSRRFVGKGNVLCYNSMTSRKVLWHEQSKR
jgi:hypothetical protein